MKTSTLLAAKLHLFLLASLGFIYTAASAAKPDEGSQSAQPVQPQTSNLLFAENKGQWENVVTFRTDVPGGTLFLEKGGFTYSLVNAEDWSAIHPPKEDVPAQGLVVRMHALKVYFQDALSSVAVSGNSPDAGYNNYFIGNDPSKWAGNVKSFREISYSRLYDGIDMRVYSQYNSLKYDFIIAPRADANQIVLRYDGADNMSIVNGDLRIGTTAGYVVESKPYAYQVINGVHVTVPCNYTLDEHTLSYAFPVGYNKDYELVIDPTLIFSTLTGSPADNWGFTATYDDLGNFYTGGVALTTGYPTTAGAFQTVWPGGGAGGGNATPFSATITKYNPTGTARIYSTHLGGSDNDFPTSMVVNSLGELFVLGKTYSPNFPTTPGAYRTTPSGNADIFVTHFNAAGSALIGSTYIGGSGDDGVNISSIFTTMNSLKYNYGDDSRSDIFLDASDNVYVASCSRSSNFPTVNPFQAALSGAQDGVVFKMNGGLTTLQWSSYIGGSADDAAYGVVLDKAGNVFITGGTNSSNFPVTTGALQTTYGGAIDGFVAKIPNAGGSILSATYLGTSSYDQTYLIQLDNSDNVYVAGQTHGPYPVTAGVYTNANSAQFIHKLDNNLSTTGFSTVIGNGIRTGANMSLTAFLVDVCENIYLSGWGRRCLPLGNYPTGEVRNMPTTPNAYQSNTNGCNFYFIQLSRNAQSLLYGSYFGDVTLNGREHVDGGTSRFDKKGTIYQSVCAACGGTQGFPTTPGVVSRTNGSSNCNNGSIKMQFDFTAILAAFTTAQAPSGCAPLNVTFVNNSVGGPNATFSWDFGDSNGSSLVTPTHTYPTPGVYNVRLIISDPTACNLADTAYLTVTVYASPVIDAGPDAAICSGRSTTLSATGGSSYVWTPSATLSNATIANPIASPTVTTTYYVTGTDANGCTGVDSVTVTVSQNITVNVSPNTAVCAGTPVQLTSSGGTIYMWSPGAGLSDSTISNPVANPSATTTYTVTVSDASGCSGTGSVTVTINPMPTVTMAPLANVCQNVAAFPLTGGSPVGGTYSGTGVSGGMFDPAVSGIGTFIIKYSYTDANGCSGEDSTAITVDPAGSVTINAIPDMCVTAGSVTLSGSPAGGTFSGTGVVGNTFDPSVAGPGPHVITYTFTSGTCLTNTTASTTVTVTPQPVATLTSTPGLNCGGGSTLATLTVSSNIGPVSSYQWYFNGTLISGATNSTYGATQSGWYNVIVVVNGCPSDSNGLGKAVTIVNAECGHDPSKKTLICHVPDCRYDKEVTICVGNPSVNDHLRNHPCDCIGHCPTMHPNKKRVGEDIDLSGIHFHVYPNPFFKEGVIDFYISDAAHTTLDIIDIRGAFVSRLFEKDAESDVEYSVNVTGLAEGIYVARLQSGDFIKHQMLVVTR